MKKYLIFLFLILISCEKDILEPLPQPTQEMIFEMGEVFIQDGQDISFEIITNTPHQLIITNEENSVVAKETFTPNLGINTRKIYTKTLSKEKLKLSLEKNGEIVQETFIIVE
jgi:hypothetical protein